MKFIVMSTCKAFLVALLTTVIIGGCGATGDDGTFDYPFQEQTWSVESGDEALWTGSASTNPKAVAYATMASDSSDTTIINKPNKYGLELVESKFENSFNITFIDSTITNTVFDSLDLGPNRSDTLFGSSLQGVHGDFQSGYLKIEYRYQFDCSADYEETDTLSIYWLNAEETDTARVYELPIMGARDVANHVVCES